jgi:hypothetical protein
MAIDFTLTPAQKALQKSAREFAQDCLKPVVQNADLEPAKGLSNVEGAV